MPNSTQLKIVVDAQDNTKGVFSSIGSNLSSLSKRTEDTRRGMMAIGAAGAVAFGGLAYMTKGVIEAGANFEQTRISFETMLGSAEAAKTTLAELQDFAQRTPFQLPEVQQGAKQLLAYGVSAKELIPTLRNLGDIAAGVGMDKMPQLLLAFGQVKSVTHLTGMELRQFSEAGVPLLGALAEQFGKTTGEVQKMVSDGKVSFADMQTALRSLTGEGGRFHDLMEKQSHSLSGLWSNFNDQITKTSVLIGTQLLPYLKPLVEYMTALVARVGEFVTAHPQFSAGLLVAVLAFTGLLAVLIPIAIALPAILLVWAGLSALFVAFVAISMPVLLIIGALGAAIILLAKNGYFTQQAWQQVWLGIQVMVQQSANNIVKIVEGLINFIIDGVNKAIDALNRVLSLAKKVPGVGGMISTISHISQVSLPTFNTDLVGSGTISKPSNFANSTPSIIVTGNTLLDENSATKIGDMIVNKLKLSATF